MDSLYQEMLEKEATKKEVNISLDDDGIMKVLMCCQAGRSCRECPYDELDSSRCRDILLNECIGLVNRLKKAKEDIAREIFEEIEKQIAFFRMYMFLNRGVKAIVNVLDELKKKYTEDSQC